MDSFNAYTDKIWTVFVEQKNKQKEKKFNPVKMPSKKAGPKEEAEEDSIQKEATKKLKNATKVLEKV